MGCNNAYSGKCEPTITRLLEGDSFLTSRERERERQLFLGRASSA